MRREALPNKLSCQLVVVVVMWWWHSEFIVSGCQGRRGIGLQQKSPPSVNNDHAKAPGPSGLHERIARPEIERLE
eukprot:scaffold8243_cov129-Isochrysis_galbana.AAC.14